MSKFGIGDRVRVTQADSFDKKRGVKNGIVGTVMEEAKAPYIKFDDASVGVKGFWAMNEFELELHEASDK